MDNFSGKKRGKKNVYSRKYTPLVCNPSVSQKTFYIEKRKIVK